MLGRTVESGRYSTSSYRKGGFEMVERGQELVNTKVQASGDRGPNIEARSNFTRSVRAWTMHTNLDPTTTTIVQHIPRLRTHPKLYGNWFVVFSLTPDRHRLIISTITLDRCHPTSKYNVNTSDSATLSTRRTLSLSTLYYTILTILISTGKSMILKNTQHPSVVSIHLRCAFHRRSSLFTLFPCPISSAPWTISPIPSRDPLLRLSLPILNEADRPMFTSDMASKRDRPSSPMASAGVAPLAASGGPCHYIYLRFR
jgi:hypothetical protein